MSGNDKQLALEFGKRKYFVGEPVTVQGTGKYYGGVNYAAVIVDIRESDNTVKIHYTEGGYKRFPCEEFKKLIVEGSNDEDAAYRLKSYEMDEDYYDPTAEAVEQVGTLKNDLEKAIEEKDFAKAHDIKLKMNDLITKAEHLKSLRLSLKVALHNKEFLEADKIYKELETLQKGAPKEVQAQAVDTKSIFKKALHRAAGGGVAGAFAMFIQVSSLMWMRTAMNYQYKYGGTSTLNTIKTLYAEGGIRRFYRGIGPALFQGPLSRFGDTAANTGVLALLNASPSTENLPVGVKTIFASATAALWRIFLMPIDTMKTKLQVDGKDALRALMAKSRAHGPSVFYHGALAASGATFAGHFPWFFTYNYLDATIPVPDTMMAKLSRNAFLGFSASVVSDTVSNSIRVVKTYKQTSSESISYVDTVKNVIKEDGVAGLFGRGLKTRILANGMQGVMFSVLWKYFDDKIKNSK
eukprot:gene251-4497_t